MSTTTIQRTVFAHSPFEFMETRQVLRVAMRVEWSLEKSGSAKRNGTLSEDRYRELVRELRRTIDDLSDASRELLDSTA